MDVDLAASTSARLRDCVERANVARRGGDIEQYRRHIEEFLFLSHAVAGDAAEPRDAEPARPLPHLVVLHDNVAIVDLLREGLLEFGFAAQVEPVRSLEVLAMKLDAFDAARPTLFIVTSPLRLNPGLAALHRIRIHALTAACPILVLTLQERPADARMAETAGASAYARLPDTIDGYAGLVERIRALLDAAPAPTNRQREA